MKHRKSPIDLNWILSYAAIPEPNTGCWLWQLFTNEHDYGRVHIVRGKCHQAHRVSYELAYGPIPKGLHIDHKCRVHCCVNPEHLEPVTQAENTARGLLGRLYTPPAYCKNGHSFGPDNVPIVRTNSRAHRCSICRKAIIKK